MQLKDKVAIVTGSVQGLGRHIAEGLAKEGAYTVIADLKGGKTEQTAKEIENKYGRKSLGIPVDVTDEKQVEALVKRTMQEFKRIDILVSNAGILISGEITEFPEKDWRKVIEVNLIGYFLSAKAVAGIMKEQKEGIIIQINSKSGKKGSYRNSAYAASKFGGIGLTQSLALELASYNIRVNAICPGNLLDSPLWVNSIYDQYAEKWGISKEEVRKKYEAQVPLGRGCKYEDVTNAVIFLAGDKSAYITGQAINVTGGQEM